MIRPTDHRLRLVYVPEREVLDLYANTAIHWSDRSQLLLPMFNGLPKDVSVLSVHHDFRSKCFHFTIHSATFSEVDDGAEIPIWEGMAAITYETVELRTEADRQREKFMTEPRVFHFPPASPEDIAGEDIPKGPQLVRITPDGKMFCVPGGIDPEFKCGKCGEMKPVAALLRVGDRGIGYCLACSGTSVGVDPAEEGGDKTVLKWPHNFVAGQLKQKTYPPIEPGSFAAKIQGGGVYTTGERIPKTLVSPEDGTAYSQPMLRDPVIKAVHTLCDWPNGTQQTVYGGPPCPQCALENGDVLSCPHVPPVGKTLVVNDDPAGVDPSEADAMFAFFKGKGKTQ